MERYKLKIGKSFPLPYMSDDESRPLVFKADGIVAAENACNSCSEPISGEQRHCALCGLTEADRLEAASRNPFRILDHYGRLDDYLTEISKIGKEE